MYQLVARDFFEARIKARQLRLCRIVCREVTALFDRLRDEPGPIPRKFRRIDSIREVPEPSRFRCNSAQVLFDPLHLSLRGVELINNAAREPCSLVESEFSGHRVYVETSRSLAEYLAGDFVITSFQQVVQRDVAASAHCLCRRHWWTLGWLAFALKYSVPSVDLRMPCRTLQRKARNDFRARFGGSWPQHRRQCARGSCFTRRVRADDDVNAGTEIAQPPAPRAAGRSPQIDFKKVQRARRHGAGSTS